MSSDDLEEVNQLPVQKTNHHEGILSIMNAYDKNQKMEENEELNFNSDTFTEQFPSYNQTEDKIGGKKIKKKVVIESSTLQLKQEFEETLKKKDQEMTKSDHETELKKLLSEAISYRHNQEKKLETAYNGLVKINNDYLAQTSTKPSMHASQMTLRSIMQPQILDNRNQHSQYVTMLQNTELNMNMLGQLLDERKEQSDEINNKLFFEEEKQIALVRMIKELEQSSLIAKEKIHNHENLLVSYDNQITQAQEKSRHYKNDGHGSKIEKNKYQRFIRADHHQKQSVIGEKKQEIEENKQDLRDAVNEYKLFQSELDKAKEINEQKLAEIREVNKKLKLNYERMHKSRQLMKELDQFDKLTKIFVYSDPHNYDQYEWNLLVQSSQKVLIRSKPSNVSPGVEGKSPASEEGSEEEVDYENYVNEHGDRNVGSPSPTYKQGTILKRHRAFTKLHGEDLTIVVDKIIDLHREYNLTQNTLQTRLDDLQEQKRQLETMARLLELEENPDGVQNQQQQDEEDNIADELKSNKRQRSNSEVMKMSKSKNKTSEEDITQLHQFIGKIFLFLNEALMRFVAVVAVIKSITLSNENVRKEDSFFVMLFRNELFDTLNDMMQFAVSSKSYYQVRDDDVANNNNKKKNNISSSSSATHEDSHITHKVIDIKKLFEDSFPQLLSNSDSFMQRVKKNFILLYFCSVEQYQELFDTASNNGGSDPYKKIEESLQTVLMESGIKQLDKVMKQLMVNLESLLKRIRQQKAIQKQHIEEKDPESPVFKPSHLRKKLEDNKKKQKDWKDRLIKNKIGEFEKYRGSTNDIGEIHFDINGGIPTDVGSLSESKEERYEDENKYIDQLWSKKKGDYKKKQKEFIESENKIQEKPKVVSRYMEQSKFGLKYSDSWKYLVKAKKEFNHYIYDVHTEEFVENKVMRGKFAQTTESDGLKRDPSKPEHLFSHVLYQKTHPHLESRYTKDLPMGSSKIRSQTLGEEDPYKMKPEAAKLLGTRQQPSSAINLAKLRKISDKESSAIPLIGDQRLRSKSNFASSLTEPISKSRYIQPDSNRRGLVVNTGKEGSGSKLAKLQTQTSALAPIKTISQFQ